MLNKGTEPPFSGKHHNCKDNGIYKLSAVAITYLPPTPNPILAPAGPVFELNK